MGVPRLELVIAGAQKAGTTSLKLYLGQHPQLCDHPPDEFTYFVNTELHAAGFESAFRQTFFDGVPAGSLPIAKSVGLLHSPEGQARLHRHNPNVRVALLLRHPVERAYSAYWYARRAGWEAMTDFEQALYRPPEELEGDPVRRRNCAYLVNGHYLEDVASLQRVFGPEQVRLFLFESFREDPIPICRELFEWLGVDADFVPDVRVRSNASGRSRLPSLTRAIYGAGPVKRLARRVLPGRLVHRLKRLALAAATTEFKPPPLDPELRRRLLEYYRTHNARLAEASGLDLSPWTR